MWLKEPKVSVRWQLSNSACRESKFPVHFDCSTTTASSIAGHLLQSFRVDLRTQATVGLGEQGKNTSMKVSISNLLQLQPPFSVGMVPLKKMGKDGRIKTIINQRRALDRERFKMARPLQSASFRERVCPIYTFLYKCYCCWRSTFGSLTNCSFSPQDSSMTSAE